jgi:hypothetical protein
MTKEVPLIDEVIRSRDGKVVERKLHPREVASGVDLMSPRGIAGSVAANDVLKNGGTIDQAIDAAVAARNKAPESQPDQPDVPLDKEMELMLRYIHSIARLHSGRFEDLTPQGMLEVAMLCPYPVNSYEEWKMRIEQLGSK